MANALLAAVRDRVSLVRALLETDAIPSVRLEEELARTSPDTPVLRHPVPVMDLFARLPPDLCAALVALPVRADTLTGTIDVAVADASDAHAAEEIGFYLSAPVRIVRSPLGAIESAIAQARHESSFPPSAGAPISVPPPSPVRPMAHTPPWGSPAFVAPIAGGAPVVPVAAAVPIAPVMPVVPIAPAGFSVEEQVHSLSERPMPLIPKTPSERGAQLAAERAVLAASERGELGPAPGSERAPAGEDIPIPLSRRLTPGRGLVALARAAQELDDEEDPVVELRRTKSSTPPEVAERLRAIEATAGAAVAAPVPPPASAPKPELRADHPSTDHHAVNGVSSPRLPREDEAPLSYSHMPLNQLLREMTKATSRDRLMELVLVAVHPLAPKCALFAVKKEAYVGWMCTAEFGEGDPLAHVQIDARKPSLLATVATVGTYLGPMPRNEANAPLAKFIKSQSEEILGVAVKAAGRPAVVLLALEVDDPRHTMSVLTEVARGAGEALERIVRAKR
jgi:hypothetical protein